MAITKNDVRRNAIAHKQLGIAVNYKATPVEQRLLQIANERIGIVGCYWYELQEGRDPDYLKPDDEKGKFVAQVDGVLASSVDHAYMLRPEQRQAAELFRGFRDYAAAVNWGDQIAFVKLKQEYDRVHETMAAVLAEPVQRVSDLQAMRMRLMGARGEPYRPAAL